jgi:tRNA(Met) C34 N-acetyltransferase TmcA
MHIYHIITYMDLLTSASFTEDTTTAESPFPATVRFTNAAVPANATRGRGRGSLLGVLLGKWQADKRCTSFVILLGRNPDID